MKVPLNLISICWHAQLRLEITISLWQANRSLHPRYDLLSPAQGNVQNQPCKTRLHHLGQTSSTQPAVILQRAAESKHRCILALSKPVRIHTDTRHSSRSNLGFSFSTKDTSDLSYGRSRSTVKTAVSVPLRLLRLILSRTSELLSTSPFQ